MCSCCSLYFTDFCDSSSHLFCVVSWGKQSQKPCIWLIKHWHERWTGIWYIKILLFLHVQWYLERLEMMLRSYLFLVKWIARGFFWQGLSTVPWQWICRKCARSWDFIHKMLQNEFSWGGSCSLLMCAWFSEHNTPENTSLSRADSLKIVWVLQQPHLC